MTPKTLEEFIKEKATPMYQTLEDGTGTQLQGSYCLEAIAEKTAAEILRFAQIKSFIHNDYTLAPGERVVTLREIEDYINSTNTEGGE